MMKILKPSASILYQAAKFKLTGKRAPVYVAFHITNKCNLKCRYCYANLKSIEKEKDFTTEEVLKLIDELCERGTRFIRLLGGEPLIRKDIGKIVDYIKKKGMICELTTNGTLLKQRVKDIKNVDSLCISIDGDKEANDFFRGKGTYDRIIEGIVAAKKHGLSIRLHAVLTKKNLNAYRHLAELSKKHGTSFNFSLYSVGTEDYCKGVSLTDKEVVEFYDNLRKLKKKGIPIFNSDVFFDHILKWPYPDKEILYKKDLKNGKTNHLIPCLSGKLSCWIDADGGVYACPALWKKGLNIRKVGFDKAFDDLKNLDCYACRGNGDVEPFAILSLNPKALFNITKQLASGKVYSNNR